MVSFLSESVKIKVLKCLFILRDVFLFHTDYSHKRFQHLRKVYADPTTGVYMYLTPYQATLQIFVEFNKFLQREAPIMCHGEPNEQLPQNCLGEVCHGFYDQSC